MRSSSGLHGEVTRALALDILTGRYRPDEALPTEMELSSRFGVGRNVLREAIKVLSSKGFVSTRPKLGSRVQERIRWSLLDPEVMAWRMSLEPDETFIRNLSDVRMIIEPAAAERAAERSSIEQIRTVTAAYDQMRDHVANADLYIEADMAFHRGILTASNNELLYQLATALDTALTLSRRVTVLVPDSAEATLPLHEDVLRAIAERKPMSARTRMEELIRQTSSHIDAVIRAQLTSTPLARGFVKLNPP